MTDQLLLLLAAPSPPQNVRVTKVLPDGGAYLEWKAPSDTGGMKVHHYHVYISHEGKDDWKKIDSPDSFKLMSEVKDLKYEKNYVLAVTAENDIDESEMAMISEPIKIDRPRDIPSPPVGPVEFSNINKTSATMSFKKSKFDGYSPITHYIVDIREKFKRTYTHMCDIRSDQELTCELTNLTEGQEYQVQIRAVNSVGTSKPLESESTVKPKSPFTLPSAPRNLSARDVTTSKGTLDWKAPEKDGGAPITKYHVEKREKTYGAWKREGTVDAPTTSLDLKPLLEGVEYYFKVCAENEAGKGPFSDMTGPVKPEKEKSKL